MRLLFWNTYGNGLAARIGRLAAAPGADIVALAENTASSADLLAALGPRFREVLTNPCRVRVFTHLPTSDLRAVFIAREYVICRLRTDGHGVVLESIRKAFAAPKLGRPRRLCRTATEARRRWRTRSTRRT